MKYIIVVIQYLDFSLRNFFESLVFESVYELLECAKNQRNWDRRLALFLFVFQREFRLPCYLMFEIRGKNSKKIESYVELRETVANIQN